MKKFVFSLSFVFLLSNNLFSQQTVEEVIVTATKTEKTLQEVPIAVSVVTADTIEKANITDIYDQRDRKKKELQFYTVELEKLMSKLGMIQQDIGVTETIIRLIENEQILDLQEANREKRKLTKE